MPPRLAILGLDPIQRDWLSAVQSLRASNEIELVGVGHRSLALAKDLADCFPEKPPAFDDPRQILQQNLSPSAPDAGQEKTNTPEKTSAGIDLLLLDRPANVSLDFLLAAIQAGTTILSLGPPVETLPEAHALAAELEPQTHLLYIWPNFPHTLGVAHAHGAEEFLRPLRFASAQWYGLNHVLAKLAPPANAENIAPPVRSLSVLAWDALATLIHYFDLPMSVYASVRGTVPSGESFADLTGSAAITLRFPDDASASVTLSDRMPDAFHTQLVLLGHGGGSANGGGGGGTITLDATGHIARNGDGAIVDETATRITETPHDQALRTLREVLRHRTLPTSPQRGWSHRLIDIAATMEALVVSHRTGQAESPERLRALRR